MANGAQLAALYTCLNFHNYSIAAATFSPQPHAKDNYTRKDKVDL